MNLNNRDEIINLTREWKGDRFEDGRPRVPDTCLNELREMTLEEIWLPLYIKGYHFQFEGEFKRLHENKKLVGRAVTCTFMPIRPDLFSVVREEGETRNWNGLCNQWVVDNLAEGDVMVVDMYDKVFNGTFVGGNLTTAIASQTKTGGAVIWGGVRDIEQMKKIDTQVCYRGVDPTPIRETQMVDYNGPCRIGRGVCLPGDVVMAASSGVLFIPSHLAEEMINSAKKSHAKDIFGFEMIERGIYTTAQVDSSVWTLDMLENMETYLNENPSCRKYRNLDWSLEIRAAKGEQEARKEVLKSCLV